MRYISREGKFYFRNLKLQLLFLKLFNLFQHCHKLSHGTFLLQITPPVTYSVKSLQIAKIQAILVPFIAKGRARGIINGKKMKLHIRRLPCIPSRVFKDFRDPRGLVNFDKSENVLLCEFKTVALSPYQPLVSPRNIIISSMPLFCSLRKVEQGMRYEYKWSSNYKQKGQKGLLSSELDSQSRICFLW